MEEKNIKENSLIQICNLYGDLCYRKCGVFRDIYDKEPITLAETLLKIKEYRTEVPTEIQQKLIGENFEELYAECLNRLEKLTQKLNDASIK